jgi:ankyrin repeat protein
MKNFLLACIAVTIMCCNIKKEDVPATTALENAGSTLNGNAISDEDHILGNKFLDAVQNKNKRQIKHFISEGVDINFRGKNGNTALHILGKDMFGKKMMRIIIKEKPNANIRNNKGNTPLHQVAELLSNNDEMAEMILELGADVTIKNDDGQTPWDILWQRNEYLMNKAQSRMAWLLLKNGQKLSVETIIDQDKGTNWVHKMAATCKNGNAIAFLFDSLGFDINSRDARGWTPLHYGVKMKNHVVVKTLLEQGADVNAQTLVAVDPKRIKRKITGYKYDKGYTPLDFEKENTFTRGDVDLKVLLREYGGKYKSEL